jgi:hypothetical protein
MGFFLLPTKVVIPLQSIGSFKLDIACAERYLYFNATNDREDFSYRLNENQVVTGPTNEGCTKRFLSLW